SGFNILHHFLGSGVDGAGPNAALIQGSDGTLYGTTYLGGTNNFGTVFKLNIDGTGYSLMHNFGQTSGDGQGPLGALVEASDGALYGTTYSGGPGLMGSVFKLNKDGSNYSVLVSFSNSGAEGQNPRSTLIVGTDRSLYGTTWGGGNA